MLRKWFQRWRQPSLNASALYAQIVAQARQPVFHDRLGVPDTTMGRFQLVALHVILVLDRLLEERMGEDVQTARELARLLQEEMFDQLDAALRELGVSDQGVPRRMQKLVEVFYGLLKSVRKALPEGEAALHEVLERNIHAAGGEAAEGARMLARYALQARAVLGRTNLQQLVDGVLHWPPVTENHGAEK